MPNAGDDTVYNLAKRTAILLIMTCAVASLGGDRGPPRVTSSRGNTLMSNESIKFRGRAK